MAKKNEEIDIDEEIKRISRKTNVDILKSGRTFDNRIKNLEKEKSDLQAAHDESKKIYDEAKESVEMAKEAYEKNGEEILRVAKENDIDVDGILNKKTNDGKENKEEMKDNGSNPKTGDNIMLYVAIASMSIIGLVATTIVAKKKKMN